LDENIIYIGSTFNQLRHRWQQHKKGYTKYLNEKNSCVSIYPYFEKFGIENFKIMKIKQYKCYREHNKDSRHLHAYEQLWINKTRCVNKISAFSIPIVAKEYKKGYRKKYQEENKEKILEQNKEYRKANKEKILEQNKEYRKANKEKINKYNKEKKKERVKCDICDKDLTRGSLTRHKKRFHPS